jgi:XRE family transcriptional regulator, regulator of sulfur utilization
MAVCAEEAISMREKMLTRRDLLIALPAITGTAGVFAFADNAHIGSSVFDWNSIPAKQTSIGSTRSFVKAPTATLEELEIHVTTLDPGKMPHPPHKHPNEELIILHQGTLEALSNGHWQRVGPGSVIFNASNDLHGLRNVGTEPATYHVINFRTAATPKTSP